MRPYDAVFLAVLASRCVDRPRRWWLALLAPLVSYGIAACWPLERFAAPATALAALGLAPGFAPVSLLLAAPHYDSLVRCLATPLVWLAASVLFQGLADRLGDRAVAPRLSGWPVRLAILGVLYYALLPLAWI